MPLIRDALTRSLLTSPGRAVLSVIDNHPKHTWSSSLEDLEEIASWAIEPTNNSPLKIHRRWTKGPDDNQWDEIQDEYPNDNGLTVRLTVFQTFTDARTPIETYALGTIKGALSELATAGLIWSFKMHRRTYYASHKARKRIENQVNKLSDREKKRLRFQTNNISEVS